MAPPLQTDGGGNAKGRGGKRGRSSLGGVSGSETDGATGGSNALATVSAYLLQSQGALGGYDTNELQTLELQLWGPPSAPGRDGDEIYVGGFDEEGDDFTAAAPGGADGTVSALEFSGLVTEGAQGVQRVRSVISERKRQARDTDTETDRRQRQEALLARQRAEDARGGGGVRASNRKSKPPARIGEDGGEEDDLDEDGAPLDPAARSHKKRPGEELAGAAAGARKGMPPPLPPGKRPNLGKLPVRRKDDASKVMDTMWSPEEDAALLRAVNAYGSGNWELIGDVLTSLLPTRYRSARACYERCLHVLLPHDAGPREPGTLNDQVCHLPPSPTISHHLAPPPTISHHLPPSLTISHHLAPLTIRSPRRASHQTPPARSPLCRTMPYAPPPTPRSRPLSSLMRSAMPCASKSQSAPTPYRPPPCKPRPPPRCAPSPSSPASSTRRARPSRRASLGRWGFHSMSRIRPPRTPPSRVPPPPRAPQRAGRRQMRPRRHHPPPRPPPQRPRPRTPMVTCQWVTLQRSWSRAARFLRPPWATRQRPPTILPLPPAQPPRRLRPFHLLSRWTCRTPQRRPTAAAPPLPTPHPPARWPWQRWRRIRAPRPSSRSRPIGGQGRDCSRATRL